MRDQAKDAMMNIRRAAESALVRLRKGENAPARENADRARFAPMDPTIGLFGDDAARDEVASTLPLAAQLEASARTMRARAEQLRADARRLARRIGERAAAEITLTTQAVRVIIGLAWLAAAAWLYNAALTAKAEDMAVLATGMPIADAFILSRTFFIVAAAGLGVAFAIGFLVKAFGKAGTERIKQEAEMLGHNIADTAREFDEALTAYRVAMDRRPIPADGIVDLSRAHLTALEASAYFREIQFLTGAEGAHASHLFRGFLRQPPAAPPPVPIYLAGLFMGLFLGAAYVYLAYVPPAEPTEPAVPLALTQYPWALMLLFFGGVAYALAGIVISVLFGFIANGAVAKAREDALDALRGAFTEREAPRPIDVIRRIEDAVDVFRARCGGKTGKAGRIDANQTAAGNRAFRGDDDEMPAWRRRDSSATFVDTGFQAAPPRWRTNPGEENLAPEPEAKRGLFRFRKQPDD